jgi:hypothetical protein
MTNTSLSIIQKIDEFQQVSKLFADSGLFSDTKTQAQCFVKIMAGAEMGLPPFTAMNAFHIIQGKVVMTASNIAARIKASGRYNYRILEKTASRCSIEFTEGGKPSHTETWDVARASKANVKNMDKFPDAMLFSRAISAGARVACPDVIGSYYTPEELGADVNEEGEVVTVTVPAAQQVIEQAAPVEPPVKDWRAELRELGTAAGELVAISKPDIATELSAAQSFAREVYAKNAKATESERNEARAALQRAIAAANEAIPA